MPPQGRLWVGAIALCLLALVGLVAHTGALPLPDAASTIDEEGTDARLTVNVTAIPCPPGYDNGQPDDVCLAYDGQVPGPTWVLEEGQRVELTVNHNVTESIQNVTDDADLKDRLADARYSNHRHGVSVDACNDGVARPFHTDVCESTVGPTNGRIGAKGTITYAFTTPFPGPWHYHDHAKGLDVGTQGKTIGDEGQHRGLFGAFLVLEEGERTDHVFDAHILDTGLNGGIGFHEEAKAGDRFDIVLTGLGDHAWDVTLAHDDDGPIDEEAIGPGLSRGFTVHDAQPGTYTLTAASTLGGYHEGQVVVS